MLSKLLNSMTSHLSLTTIVTKVLTVSCAGSRTHHCTATPPVGWSLQQWTLQRRKGFNHGNAGDIQLWRGELCICVLAAKPSGKTYLDSVHFCCWFLERHTHTIPATLDSYDGNQMTWCSQCPTIHSLHRGVWIEGFCVAVHRLCVLFCDT